MLQLTWWQRLVLRVHAHVLRSVGESAIRMVLHQLWRHISAVGDAPWCTVNKVLWRR